MKIDRRKFKVRPFGVNGPIYGVDRVGLISFQMAVLCVPIGIALEAYARNFYKQLQWPIALGSLAVCAVAIAITLARGKRIEKQ